MGKLRLVPALTACIAAAVALAGPPGAQASTPEFLGAATHPLWGSSTDADSAAELDRLVEAGANAVRIDIAWSTLEEQGEGDLSEWYVDKADTFFAQARTRGLRVIATFWSTPCWASSAPDDLKQGCTGPWWDRGVHLYPPTDPAHFARGAAWVAERWGDDLAALEIWNEPNNTQFFTSPSNTHAADYVRILQPAYQEVKAVAPGVEVLGPAMLFSHGEFLEAVYGQGARGYMDGVSVRPYSQWRDPTDETVPAAGQRMFSLIHGVEWLREIMAAHGDSATPMWFTEIGWSSCAPHGTNNWCVTPEIQARNLGAALRLVRDRWEFVRGISVYNLRNKGDALDNREEQMGLLSRDFAPKPAFWAFKDALADLTANPSPMALPVASSQAATASQETGAATTVDLAGPGLGRLVLSRTVLRRGGPRVLLRFHLSEAAMVTLRFERARGGRWVAVPGSLRRAGKAGGNRLRLSERLRGRRLGAGRYRLTAVARDAAGNASAVRRARLRIVMPTPRCRQPGADGACARLALSRAGAAAAAAPCVPRSARDAAAAGPPTAPPPEPRAYTEMPGAEPRVGRARVRRRRRGRPGPGSAGPARRRRPRGPAHA